ncbi:C4-dicarboxylate ABC transporter substrate-binding protein [Stutzerimonas stutzeri]|uniref:C4-dicarboxylate ABC transporter substrate-binding protein n=1 Tax=Stutzerimonas stutzeri TaxID=316 RepID=W8RCL7_STUST|nr:TRAP transporter substrate-binding protein DctP [Stutzerimonas stutzeri]AHL77488.1 C4-dicarboxylate ABC transporter substrate-binding protein [Stutzerimonas stutzeri]MCQ4330386.1 TRAP transporter substrate-binding protein DctP [Stutzerimonas stutzeri]
MIKLKQFLAATVTSCSLAAINMPLQAAELVLPNEVAASHWKTAYMNEFAAMVDKRTSGSLDVKVFPSSQLYNDQDALAALGTGAVQMVWPVSVRIETIDPRLGAINLPFTLTDKLMNNQCYAKGLTELMSSYVEPRQLKILGLLRAADLFFIMSQRDVRQMSDFKGTKIRVIGGRVFLDTIRALDASPVSMPASEMSTALGQGAIDGVFTSAGGWAEMIGQTGKHAYYVPNFSLTTYAVVVDKAWFDDLSKVEQDAITSSMDEISTKQWKEVVVEDQKLIDKMVAGGATFTQATAQETEAYETIAAKNKKLFANEHPDVLPAMDAIEKRCL